MSVPFVALIIGLAVVAFSLYLQEVLDFSLQAAVRQVQLGQVPSTYSGGDFAAKVFCPALAPFAPCTNIVMTLKPVPDYTNFNDVGTPAAAQLGNSGGFCIGLPGQLMFARVVYLAPSFSQFWPYATQATVNGVSGSAFLSSAAFANENPSGAAVPAGSGC